MQQPVRKRLKDWIRVNGIVAIVFSLVIIVDVIVLLQNPQVYVDVVKNFGVDVPLNKVKAFFWVMLAYGIVLLVHVIWTFTLMKKNKEYFQDM